MQPIPVGDAFLVIGRATELSTVPNETYETRMLAFVPEGSFVCAGTMGIDPLDPADARMVAETFMLLRVHDAEKDLDQLLDRAGNEAFASPDGGLKPLRGDYILPEVVFTDGPLALTPGGPDGTYAGRGSPHDESERADIRGRRSSSRQGRTWWAKCVRCSSRGLGRAWAVPDAPSDEAHCMADARRIASRSMSFRDRLDTLSRGEIAGLIVVLVAALGGAGLWYVRSLPKPVTIAQAAPGAASARVGVTESRRHDHRRRCRRGRKARRLRVRRGRPCDRRDRTRWWPLPMADLSLLNLAAPLTDGTQILVPKAGPPGVSCRAADATGSSGGLININSASATELETLSGIGEVLAATIVDTANRTARSHRSTT